MEQELHQVVRDQQHQAQSVEAKHTGHAEREGKTELTQDTKKEKVNYRRAGDNTEHCQLHILFL